jgi:hypothetical protein
LATYKVVAGPAELVGKDIEVVVPCVEMPRRMYSSDAGDLESFDVGALHYLALGKENFFGVTVVNEKSHANAYYLRAASLHVLRPNTSPERTREK